MEEWNVLIKQFRISCGLISMVSTKGYGIFNKITNDTYGIEEFVNRSEIKMVNRLVSSNEDLVFQSN